MARLISDFYNEKETTSFTNEESVIANYILQNSPNENYSELIKDDERYFIKYHFSDYRDAILRWYPFKKDASALLIGGEYGAIVGALCDACSSVTVTEQSIFKARLIQERYKNRKQLTIYAGNAFDINFKQKFDYIVFFDNFEKEKDANILLQKLHALLKDTGVLLLKVDNQYGLQYIAGKKEAQSGKPFETFNKSRYQFYNKAKLKTLFEQSLFTNWRFYYPLPDAISPRALYSDEGKPKANMIERLVLNYQDTSTYICNDRQLFIDAVENDMYGFLANQFIIELCTKNAKPSDVLSATLSPYRSREKSFAVIIHANNQVEKKGLYTDSKDYAKYLCNIVKELNTRGIKTLQQNLQGNSFFMDYISAPTLQLHIKALCKCAFATVNSFQNDLNAERLKAREEILNILERLYQKILQSSPILDKKAVQELAPYFMHAGPILQKAYLEMITINCFWVNNDFLFFDQEYVKENYPAKYVLFRSISFIFGNIQELKDILTKEEVYAKFDISDALEKLFYQLNRELDKQENPYQFFYKSELNELTIQKNRCKLLREE